MNTQRKTSPGTCAVVGGGLAGAKAVETLREEGFDGRVVLFAQESERPYERPPLSKGYLLGSQERNSAFVHDEGWYAEHDVDLRLGTPVTSLDRSGHVLTVAGGQRVPYDRLLLATGAEPRRLHVPGADLDGVLYLRTLPDSDRLRRAFASAARVVVVGAGWIGLETAAAARAAGAEVTVVETRSVPLEGVLGARMGEVFAGLHRDHGVRLLTDTQVAKLRAGAGGAVESVVTADGRTLAADVVVVGVGVTAAADLALRSGLSVDGGVLVDSALRTHDPNVFAAGDVASAYNPLFGTRVRVEHWANALHQGPAAARSMLGREVVFDRVPYFFSDQYDLGMEYSGWAPPGSWDTLVCRGEPRSREFVAFWLHTGRVLAAMNVNVWDVTEPLQRLVRSARPVDPDRLVDPDVPLEALAR